MKMHICIVPVSYLYKFGIFIYVLILKCGYGTMFVNRQGKDHSEYVQLCRRQGNTIPRDPLLLFWTQSTIQFTWKICQPRYIKYFMLMRNVLFNIFYYFFTCIIYYDFVLKCCRNWSNWQMNCGQMSSLMFPRPGVILVPVLVLLSSQ